MLSKPEAMIHTFSRITAPAHLCLLYENPEEWQEAVVTYLKARIERGDKCIYIADGNSVSLIRSRLARGGFEVEAAENSGKFSIVSCESLYINQESFEPDRVIAFLRTKSAKALAEGYPTLCLTSEMSWSLRGQPEAEKMLEFEARLNREYFPQHPVVSLCQYDRRKVHPEIIKGVIMNHPRMVLNGLICENSFYIPSEEFLSSRRGEREVLNWLTCLRANTDTQDQWKCSIVEGSFHHISRAIESTSDAILMTDVQGQAFYLNRAFFHLFEYSLDEINQLGGVSQLFMQPELAREVFDTVLAGHSWTGEADMRTRSGQVVPISLSADSIEDDNGKTIGLIGIHTNITEQKRIEMEMARLDRLNLVGEMAASIGHEIRNPITTVRGFLQVLGNKEDQSGNRKYFDLMIDELDRANAIITEYLSLAKNKTVDLKARDLNHIIESLAPLIQADAAASGKLVELQLKPLPSILLDEKEIRQLILNLVKNGLEAMPSGGILNLLTYTEDQEAVLAVKDQGAGIDPQVLDKIGTPFFTTKEYGTGLGLAVCYSIAARHNAVIKVETGPSGVTFFVRFKTHSSSLFDSLTGLYSRRYFEEEMQRMDEGRFAPLGIIVCELEIPGHDGSFDPQNRDQLMLEASKVVKRCLRESDIIARVGINQLAVLLANSTRALVEKACCRIRDGLARYNSENPRMLLNMTISFAIKNEKPSD